VLFSDQELAKKINDHFVSTWIDKGPQHTFAPGIYAHFDRSRTENFAVGTGVTNITAVFATADGTVLDAIPGYLDREKFEAEMDFALDLAKKLEACTSKDQARSAFAASHRAQLEHDRGLYAHRAHERLAEVGLLTLHELGLDYFDDFNPRERGCAIR
jgi:hypothetical protein